jgi:predicted small metal-binding protein
MAKVINCDCGFVVHGADDAELIRNAQAHARDVHNMEMLAGSALATARQLGMKRLEFEVRELGYSS